MSKLMATCRYKSHVPQSSPNDGDKESKVDSLRDENVKVRILVATARGYFVYDTYPHRTCIHIQHGMGIHGELGTHIHTSHRTLIYTPHGECGA